jgi:hypothetical protein
LDDGAAGFGNRNHFGGLIGMLRSIRDRCHIRSPKKFGPRSGDPQESSPSRSCRGRLPDVRDLDSVSIRVVNGGGAEADGPSPRAIQWGSADPLYELTMTTH